MESTNSPGDERSGYGKAVGLSVASAALIGTVVSAMFGKKESKQDRARREAEERLASLEATASLTLGQLTSAVQGFRDQARTEGRKSSKKVSKSATKLADQAVAAVSDKAKELEKEAKKIRVTESTHGLGNDLSRRASNLTRVLSERGSDLVDEARSYSPGWKSKAEKSLNDVRDRSLTLARNVKDDNAAIGKKGRELAADISETSAHLLADVRSKTPAIREKAPEVREQVSHLAEQLKEKAPEVQERASHVAAQVGEKAAKATSQAREKAPGLLESAGHQLTTILEEAQETAKPHVDDAAKQARQAGKRFSTEILPEVQERASHLTEVLDSQAHSATDRIAHTTSAVEQRSKQAAVAAGEGSKNLGALIGWSAAAAGVVYYAFLDDAKRAKVKASGGRILNEAREVIQDIRGQDGQFQ